MNIWLINHYAVPPQYYPLARTTNFAKYLMRMGHTVTIFAASSVHNSTLNLITDDSLYREETVDGIHYVYVRCRTYQGNGKQRIINMFEFPRRLKKVCRCFPGPDAVMASSATPPACMAGLKIAKKHGARAVAEISDLWPLSFVDYGMVSARNPALIPMYAYEKRMYQYADAIIFTMEGGYDYIVEKGWDKDVPREKVFYINNGVDLELFDYNREHFQIRDPDLDDPDTFKVVYTGSIRKANHVENILEVARLIEETSIWDIRFLIFGDGEERASLEKNCPANAIFKGQIEKNYVPYVLSKGAVNLWNFVETPLLRYGASPNKLFDYLASGRPIIATGKVAYNPVVQRKAGIETRDSAPNSICEAVLQMYHMAKEDMELMGKHARDASKEYDFQVLSEKLLKIIGG